jgi:hypothetical protein
VAKARGQTAQQLRRAIVYLEAIHQTDFAPHRVLGMLSEFSAVVGDLSAYREYRRRAEAYAKSHKNRLTQSQLEEETPSTAPTVAQAERVSDICAAKRERGVFTTPVSHTIRTNATKVPSRAPLLSRQISM